MNCKFSLQRSKPIFPQLVREIRSNVPFSPNWCFKTVVPRLFFFVDPLDLSPELKELDIKYAADDLEIT